MNKIHLTNILPDVFMQRNDLQSDIWCKDVEIEKGSTYLIEANSGTGKSSLLSFIYGYRKDYQGEILFDDANTREFSSAKWIDIRKKHISLLWQELRLFPELTAMENIRIKNNLTGYQKKSKVKEWFEMLGIADKKETLIGQMSYGQQQRVALIRALCQPFDFLFIDEPISHLDDSNAEIMGNILMTEAKRQGAAVVATSIGRHIDIDYDKTFRL